LNPQDIPELSLLVEQAGWNQLPGDWLRLIKLEPKAALRLEFMVS
jgi:hypothetical protein